MVADITFFCLDTKEPKSQAFRIASGRNAALRAWVATVLVIIFLALAVIPKLVEKIFSNK